jgi:hypothetical protein|tara:strand:+ start:1571 stop:1852 length:282 start_codon:yes stop_codon:yes gene_type:complete
MVKKGSIVRRKPNDFCSLSLRLRHDALISDYPPEREICIVTLGPRETDLSRHDRIWDSKSNHITLKKAIEVIYDGRWYGPCDIAAFEEVKKHD